MTKDTKLLSREWVTKSGPSATSQAQVPPSSGSRGRWKECGLRDPRPALVSKIRRVHKDQVHYHFLGFHTNSRARKKRLTLRSSRASGSCTGSPTTLTIPGCRIGVPLKWSHTECVRRIQSPFSKDTEHTSYTTIHLRELPRLSALEPKWLRVKEGRKQEQSCDNPSVCLSSKVTRTDEFPPTSPPKNATQKRLSLRGLKLPPLSLMLS